MDANERELIPKPNSRRLTQAPYKEASNLGQRLIEFASIRGSLTL